MICLMGEFHLEVGGNLVQLPAGGKMETLLSYLALQPERRIGRERLLQALWPSNDPARGLNSLNTLAYTLNKLLDTTLDGVPLVLHKEGYYLLNPHLEIGVDVRCFDGLLATADHKIEAGDSAGALVLYQRAVKLYRDDLCIATDIQALIERERLRTRYLLLLVELANNCYLAGNYNTSLEYLWKLLGHDPFREDAHRLVMQCYVRRGARASALHQYQVCVDLLQSEFKALPEMATLALFEQICTDPGSV